MVAAAGAATWMKLAAKYCSSIITVAVITRLASGNYFASCPCRRHHQRYFVVITAAEWWAAQDCP